MKRKKVKIVSKSKSKNSLAEKSLKSNAKKVVYGIAKKTKNRIKRDGLLLVDKVLLQLPVKLNEKLPKNAALSEGKSTSIGVNLSFLAQKILLNAQKLGQQIKSSQLQSATGSSRKK